MDNSTKLQTKAELILLLMTFIWGSSFVISKILLINISSILYLIIRCLISIFILFIIFKKDIIQNFNLKNMLCGLFLGIPLAVGLILQNYGLQITTASKSAYLSSLMVIFAPIFQIIILKKRPSVGNFVGIVIVLIGIYFLTNPESSEINIGDLLNIIAAILFGLYTVLLDKFSREINTSILSLFQIMCTLLIGFLFLPFEKIKFDINANIVFGLLYMSIFATVLTIWIQTNYQKFTTPTKAVIIFSIEPVIATIFASYILNESFSTIETIGAICILFGIMISELWETIFNYFKSSNKIIVND
ncbi:MAG: DMT family transporter [Bacteroidetes bacterium]|nr:DMT family transporter [Bacteroidota bacterium]